MRHFRDKMRGGAGAAETAAMAHPALPVKSTLRQLTKSVFTPMSNQVYRTALLICRPAEPP